MVRSGVLALQGCVTPQLEMLKRLGVSATLVRSPNDLEGIDHLILPGGESTTMLKLLHSTLLFSSLIKFAQTKALWGICAGAILLAKEVINPAQESLGLVDVLAERNSYGPQTESFETKIAIPKLDLNIEAQFIRAPRLKTLSPKAEVLAEYNGDPVCIKQGRLLLTSFHVELGNDSRLHQYFLGL